MFRELNCHQLSLLEDATVRGALAGNGEYMPGKKQQSIANEAPANPSRERKNPKKQPNRAAQTRREPRTRRPPNASSKALAVILSQKALAGDVDSARLLVTMADRAKSAKPPEPPKKKRRGLTYAQQLALDPPWQGERPPRFVSIYDSPPKTGL